jgi:transcriptional regulator with XRE-family HTH domain
MQPDEIKAARHALGLTVTEMAERLRLQMPNGRTTVRQWENGDREISGPAAAAIELMLAKQINGQRILEAIERADDEIHPSFQAYIDGDELTDVVLDGRFDLERVAEILNEIGKTATIKIRLSDFPPPGEIPA